MHRERERREEGERYVEEMSRTVQTQREDERKAKERSEIL